MIKLRKTILLRTTQEKLGSFLVNKFLQKLIFSKNVNNKKSAPQMIFFNEKKLERFGSFLT